jgi:hypothetical protein
MSGGTSTGLDSFIPRSLHSEADPTSGHRGPTDRSWPDGAGRPDGTAVGVALAQVVLPASKVRSERTPADCLSVGKTMYSAQSGEAASRLSDRTRSVWPSLLRWVSENFAGIPVRHFGDAVLGMAGVLSGQVSD